MIAAINEIVPHSVLMRELQSAASEVIARATGAEAGCVTGCTAAGIVVAVAACMTGRDLGRVEQLPDTTGMKNEVVMQKGHEITYGHNVSQNVRIAGASLIEIGAATAVRRLSTTARDQRKYRCGAVRHFTADGAEPVDRSKNILRRVSRTRVPVIVDAASVSDPRPYVEAGGDLVLFSAHKQFGSITAGVIAGRLPLVQACIYQEHGIGRPMKVGKEGVAGAIAALEAWTQTTMIKRAANWTRGCSALSSA